MPLFSIVIPTYNRAECLRSTLKSVLNQTFADFEILVMDDGSTDHTRELVESFADGRIIYSWAKNSGGPATPRNRGIDAATAEWICFLDADDIWYPEKLEETNKAISNNSSIDAVCNDEWLVFNDCDKKKRLVYGPFVPAFYRTMLIEGNQCSTSAMSVKRSFLNKHNLRFNINANYVIVEDFDLWLRMAEAGANFKFINLALGEYLIKKDNISLNISKYLHNLEVLLRDHVYRIQTFESDKVTLWRRVSIQLQIAQARKYISSGQLGTAFKIALKTLTNSPNETATYLFSKFKKDFKKMCL